MLARLHSPVYTRDSNICHWLLLQRVATDTPHLEYRSCYLFPGKCAFGTESSKACLTNCDPIAKLTLTLNFSKWADSGSADRAIQIGATVAQWIKRFQVGPQWLRAAVALWLKYSPPTKANRVRFPAGVPLRIFTCGNRSRRSGISSSPPFRSGAAPYSPRFTLIGSQDLDIKGDYPNGHPYGNEGGTTYSVHEKNDTLKKQVADKHWLSPTLLYEVTQTAKVNREVPDFTNNGFRNRHCQRRVLCCQYTAEGEFGRIESLLPTFLEVPE
ncbi:hypothetical protein PR048_021232 [Dryococelus australis]|uniref:Uncharacterized protein n=1 Tax=Dryococelus australis TaxID=614101 RepID=A0ABQ9GXN1_9NEOP|nr:hypothetical protein PR048_021232 [Dryococelus australis]